MLVSVVTYESAVESQEFLLKNLRRKMLVFGSHAFAKNMIPRTTADLSFVSNARAFWIHIVKSSKFVSKGFQHLLIMVWNNADYLIKRLGLNNSEVARLVFADARMSNYSMSKLGQPHGGKLAPTFVDELINVFCREGLNLSSFEVVRTSNSRVGKRHDST